MSDLDDYYAKGAEDAMEGDYDPPHSDYGDIDHWTQASCHRDYEENEAYKKGYWYTKGFLQGKEGDYDPPSNNHREWYLKGYEAGKED